MNSKKGKEEEGLVVAWLEDNPDTIERVVQYLESRNFVINITKDIKKFQSWVLGNSIDSLLVDVVLTGHQRTGVQVINELHGSGVHVPIFPVSAYLDDYYEELVELSDDFKERSVDKRMFDETIGIEKMRQLLLEGSGGGKIKVIERTIGYIEEEDKKHGNVIVRVEFPNGERGRMELRKEVLAKLGSGETEWGLEIKTVERKHADGIKLQTFFRWLRNGV